MERRRHALGDVCLNAEDVLDRSLDRLRPHGRVVGGAHQLGAHPHAPRPIRATPTGATGAAS